MYAARLQATFENHARRQSLYSSVGTTKHLHAWEKSIANSAAWSSDVEGHGRWMSKVCSQIVTKCLCLARIGRPDSYMVCEFPGKGCHQMEQTCHRLLARLFSYIHVTKGYREQSRVGNRLQMRVLFQDTNFADDLNNLKSTSGVVLCIFGSHTSVSFSWTCKKYTEVSHSSTEAEIISLDAGPSLHGEFGRSVSWSDVCLL